jgi:methylase of polypeptide subunit release factors
MAEKIYSTELTGNVRIFADGNVWPPYSAFNLARETFPVIKNRLNRQGNLLCCDIGTGSGVLSILGGKYFPDSHWVATDLNPQAVFTAENNWKINGLPDDKLTSLVADGISDDLVNLARENGGFNLLVANLPQQPLVNGEELESLRQVLASAWNVDATRDPDGLGLFIKVVERLHEVMVRNGGIAVLSASSKQNEPRWRNFLNRLTHEGKLNRWEVISNEQFPVPESYDPRFIQHWLSLSEKDGVLRLKLREDGKYYYTHHNLLLSF